VTAFLVVGHLLMRLSEITKNRLLYDNSCYQLRPLRHVRRSLDRDSATILVHAFVTSRIDYDNSLFANGLKIWIDELQRVMIMNGCRASHRRHTKIRPWPGAISTSRSTPAGHPTAHHVQAVSAGVQVLTRLDCEDPAFLFVV